jgi:hypothetical protein
MGASVNGPRVALVTEYMSGGTLYARLHPAPDVAQPLPLPDLVRMAVGMARGAHGLSAASLPLRGADGSGCRDELPAHAPAAHHAPRPQEPQHPCAPSCACVACWAR